MSYHHDGTVLASCSFDGLLRLWDTSTGHCLVTRALENAEHPLSCIEFSPNGEQQDMRLACACDAVGCCIWCASAATSCRKSGSHLLCVPSKTTFCTAAGQCSNAEFVNAESCTAKPLECLIQLHHSMQTLKVYV